MCVAVYCCIGHVNVIIVGVPKCLQKVRNACVFDLNEPFRKAHSKCCPVLNAVCEVLCGCSFTISGSYGIMGR